MISFCRDSCSPYIERIIVAHRGAAHGMGGVQATRGASRRG
jgi:hypothetical protein